MTTAAKIKAYTRMIDPLLNKSASATDSSEKPWREDKWDNVALSGALSEDDFEIEPPQLRQFSKIAVAAAATVTALLLLLGAVGMWYLHQVNPSGGGSVAVTFTVNDGDTVASVSERLLAEDLITNAAVFRWYVARKGGIELIPGYYQIIPHDHFGNIRKRLATAPSDTFVKVTFPEGFTLQQIGERLVANAPQISIERFNEVVALGELRSKYQPEGQVSIEGMLFPDTYQVAGNDTPETVLQRMLGLMERVGRQENLAESNSSVGVSPYKALIIASLIEREAKVGEDRAKIARVIYNRLALGMKLQIDATLYYGAAAGAQFSELKAIDTPYNTYLNKGLPPTPIASPGRAAIIAALNPAPNPSVSDPICKNVPKPCQYLFYVLANPEGGHVFAATLAQHEQNVAKAREAGLLP